MRVINVSLALVAIASAGICNVGCSSDDNEAPASPDAAAEAAPDVKVTSDAKPPVKTDTGGGGGPVMCANSTGTCADTPIAGGVANLTACCSTANKKCGSDISAIGMLAGMIPGGMGGPAPMLPADTCIEKNQPGSDDPSCPDQSLLGLMFKGCCTAQNKCGNRGDTLSVPIVGSLTLGFGCVDPAALGMTPDGGAKSCVYNPDAGTSEGGTPDGGTPSFYP